MSLENLAWFLGGLLGGAIIGVVVMALCVASGNNRRDGE